MRLFMTLQRDNSLQSIIEKARWLSEEKACATILLAYLTSVGAATFRHIHKVFLWDRSWIIKTLEWLRDQKQIVVEKLTGQDEEWYCIPQIIDK